jgi:hypothetical protein
MGYFEIGKQKEQMKMDSEQFEMLSILLFFMNEKSLNMYLTQILEGMWLTTFI